MRIVKWLSPRRSTVNGHALVRVEAAEIADIEAMLSLVDHANVGNFGWSARIIKTGEPEPAYRPATYRGKPIGAAYSEAEQQFGFCAPAKLREQVRYYEVFVDRD